MSQKIDQRIVDKIYQLVGEGVRQVREMERHIKIFVKNELFRNGPVPSCVNRRFYPQRKDIGNHMYHATVKNRLAKLDQENLLRKIKEWEQQSPTDKFFFRGYGEVLDEEGYEKDEEDILEDSNIVKVMECNLLFILQDQAKYRCCLFVIKN